MDSMHNTLSVINGLLESLLIGYNTQVVHALWKYSWTQLKNVL